ncbi:MAG: aminotransferase class IV [Deltaproteobacteria bacterium]|nr:aminotransferase class IV [Deltaproteobacteria bacterium]
MRNREMERFIVFLNNSFVPASKANVSIFDRGILYGDGLFETIRAYKGRVFALEQHLKRLSLGAKVLRIPLIHASILKTNVCQNIIQQLLELNNLHDEDSYIRITLTRGVDYGGLMPRNNIKPTMIIVAKPIASNIQKKQKAGIGAITVDFSRAYSKISLVKSLNFLDNVIGSMKAMANGADEAIFLSPDREVLEGTTSNVFIVKDGIIKTPPIKSGILTGITRGFIIDISENMGIRVKETTIKTLDVIKSDEAFITNSIIEVVPLIRLNKKSIGRERPGKITRLLQMEYNKQVKPTRALAHKGA